MYDDFDDLPDKLEYFLLNIDEISEQNVRRFIERYDCERMAGVYDNVMTMICINEMGR